MSKKKKTKERGGEAPPVREESISRRGKAVIAAGIVLLCCGFFVLSLTDPAGRNWASILSPFLILGAYGVIGFGIFLPDPA